MTPPMIFLVALLVALIGFIMFVLAILSSVVTFNHVSLGVVGLAMTCVGIVVAKAMTKTDF